MDAAFLGGKIIHILIKRTICHIGSLLGLAGVMCLFTPAFSGASVDNEPSRPRYASIDEAIARNDIGDVRRYITFDPTTANQGKHPGLMPLHQAILRKRAEIAVLLIEAGADVNRPDRNQRSPLHLTVERNLPQVAKRLLDKGADPDTWDNIGWTPLHHAAARDRLDVARVLLEGGAEVSALTVRGGTPLHEAAASGSKEMVELLLGYGVNPAVVASDGGTALEVAREFGNEPAITILAGLE